MKVGRKLVTIKYYRETLFRIDEQHTTGSLTGYHTRYSVKVEVADLPEVTEVEHVLHREGLPGAGSGN